MVIITIPGLDGYMFNIDIGRGASLLDLKMDINRHLRNRIEEQIYNDLNLDFNISFGEMDDETFEKVAKSTLFKWLNANKTKYITLIKNDIRLDDDNFKNIEFKTNDIINYVIKQRF